MTAIEWPLLKGFIFQDSSHASIVSPQKLLLFVLLYLVSKELHAIMKTTPKLGA